MSAARLFSPDDPHEVSASSRQTPPNGAIYRLWGPESRGGEYNSHILFVLTVAVLTWQGIMPPPAAGWIALCLAAAFLLDTHRLKRKVALRPLPGQAFLYGQLVIRAFLTVLPHYVFAFGVYICVMPLREQLNVGISSMAMLYAFYLTIRVTYLAWYTAVLLFAPDGSLPTVFSEQRANLRDRRTALRHVWWSFFLGNTGLFAKCSVQIMTIGLFEFIRRRLDIDITTTLYVHHAGWVTAAGVTGVLIGVVLSIRGSSEVYYRAHRTLHVSRSLFDSIHAIHHRGILPTPLDSGTISPLEYFITDMARPTYMLLPDWGFVVCEVVLALFTHLPAHTSGTDSRIAGHHLAHHLYVVCNFGLLPSDDRRWGTLYEPASEDSRRAVDRASPRQPPRTAAP